MDVFLMIRRHKTTIFTEAKESSTVLELKRIVQGILHRPPEEQRLYKDEQLLGGLQDPGRLRLHEPDGAAASPGHRGAGPACRGFFRGAPHRAVLQPPPSCRM